MAKPKAPKVDPLVPEALSAGSAERLGCIKCGLSSRCPTAFAKPTAPVEWNGKLLLLTSVNGNRQETALLRDLWREAGYTGNDVALAGVVRCATKAKPTMAQLRACRPFLLRVIELLKPTAIVAIGPDALRSLRNVGDEAVTAHRGRPLAVPGLSFEVKAYCTYGTDALAAGTTRSAIIRDLQRPFQQQTETPRVAVPTTSALSVDAEWAPDGSLLTVGLAGGTSAIAVETTDPGWSAVVEDALASASVLVGHSVAGDVSILLGQGLGAREEWATGSAVRDSLIAVRSADENRQSYELETTLLEDMAFPPWKHRTVAFSKSDATTWPVEERRERCRLDAWAAWQIAKRYHGSMRPDVAAFTNRIALTLERVNIAGAFVHMKRFTDWAGDLEETVTKERHSLITQAALLGVAPFEPTNDNHIRAVLFDKLGLEPPVKTKTGLAGVDKTSLMILKEQLDNADQSRPSVSGRGLRSELLGFGRGTRSAIDSDDTIDDADAFDVGYGVGNLLQPEHSSSYDSPLGFAGSGAGFLDTLLRYNRVDKQYTVNAVGLRDLLTPLWPAEQLYTAEQHQRNHPCGDSPVSRLPDRGYLPFRINPLGARTGRRSATRPNSQNWPKAARSMVTSRWAGGRIGAFDYRKLEVILIAWLSKDDKLLRFFSKGNGYIDVARELLKYDVSEGAPEYRAIKSVVLGVHYNLQTPHMAHNLWTLYPKPVRFSADYEAHVAETDHLRNLYLKMFPGINRFMEERKEEAQRFGYVENLLGRRRHLGSPGRLPWHALNQAINYPVQSLASEVTGSALVDIEEALLAEAGLSYVEWHSLLLKQRKLFLTQPHACDIIIPVSTIFNEVHDEVTADLFPDHIKRDTELIVETMRAVPSLRRLAPGFDVVIDVDPKVSRFWHHDD